MEKLFYCHACDHKEGFKGIHVKRYHYVESGLPNLYLIGGVTRGTCPACKEEYTTIQKPKQLHKAIKNIILKKKDLLSGDEIRFLRKELGYSQLPFANLLGITRETVNRFENEAQEVSPTLDRLIRFIAAESDKDQRYFLHDAFLSESLVKLKKNMEFSVDDENHWAMTG